jgi:hypothetical protein
MYLLGFNCNSCITMHDINNVKQLYCIRTTLRVSDCWVHHQVYTDLKFVDKCKSCYDVSVSVHVGSHSTQ